MIVEKQDTDFAKIVMDAIKKNNPKSHCSAIGDSENILAWVFFGKEKTKKMNDEMGTSKKEDVHPSQVTGYIFLHSIAQFCRSMMSGCTNPSSVYEIVGSVTKHEAKEAILEILRKKFPNQIEETEENISIKINISEIEDEDLLAEIMLLNKIIREENKKS